MRKSNPKPADLAAPIAQRLNAYALAAGAAGVSALAVSPAQAEIVYTPVEVTVSLSGPTYYLLNPANQTTTPFLFGAGFTDPNFYWDTLSFKPYSQGARVAQLAGGRRWSIAPLKPGVVIGPERHFDSRFSNGLVATIGSYGGGTYYNHAGFKFNDPTYIGLRFLIGTETHYGWARVTARYNPSTPERRLYGQLTGYAYESVADRPIRAGQTSGTFLAESPNESTPQTGLETSPAPAVASNRTLGALASGSGPATTQP